MSILKNRLKKLFTQIPNKIITDLSISAPALRMYLYISSKHDGWIINNKDVMNKLCIGSNNSISKYWKQLIISGWVSRERIRDDKGKFLNEYEYTLYESPILVNSTEIAKSANQVEPKSQNLLITKNSYLGESANYNNKDNINKKENINNNSLSISLVNKKEKERENNFLNLSFKDFKSYLISNYSNYILIKYLNDEYISISSSGYLELNSKLVDSKQSFELWNYLYSNRFNLKPFLKQELENILNDIKSKQDDINFKVSEIDSKIFMNVLDGNSYIVSVLDILDNNRIKVQFDYFNNRFVIIANISDFLKFNKFIYHNSSFEFVN